MGRRSYAQYCALAQALDVIGERWTPLIVRELRAGPKRYSDLVANLPGIGTSLLAERLRHLESEGVIARAFLPPPAASTVYELTDDGRALGEALLPLAAWGMRRLGKPRRGQAVRLEWIMTFMAAAFDEDAARDVNETYEFRLPPGTFHIRVDDGRLELEEGPATDPDLVVTSDLETFAAIGAGTVDTAAALASGRLKIEGSPVAARNVVEIFPTPATVPASTERAGG